MREHGVVCSDALRLDASEADGVYVRALAALREGSVVATIPHRACVTPRMSRAMATIKDAQLGGMLALAFAVMYEHARGAKSPWYGYPCCSSSQRMRPRASLPAPSSIR